MEFSTKKGFKIRDPPISWYSFGTKNHEMRGPSLLVITVLLHYFRKCHCKKFIPIFRNPLKHTSHHLHLQIIYITYYEIRNQVMSKNDARRFSTPLPTMFDNFHSIKSNLGGYFWPSFPPPSTLKLDAINQVIEKCVHCLFPWFQLIVKAWSVVQDPFNWHARIMNLFPFESSIITSKRI